ncbi:DUF3108 domain-containing protein [Bacteriovorax sp. Seq25_V]|uniref:DUF3108 domain-containing protein n=1 Tax=Bacteriovorax sp. Seq25_V TaxID=1201288 RepID=UPI00038A51FA|nr:DUF3108 domain-containing protein [Bacteriovorax sp. Seq25_V]EQC47394.1 PF11306 family protein [Bacteriovorax sp. Seq25_V]
MFKFILVVSLFGLISSCASKNDFTEPSKVDLVKVFEIDKSKLENFETKPVSAKVDKKEKSSVVKSKNSTTKLPIKKETSSKKNKESDVIEKVDLEETTPEVVKPENHPDYPPEFIKYNTQFKKYWVEQKPFFKVGEKFKLSVSWSIFKAGDIELETLGELEIGGRKVIGFKAKMESAEYFESIYKLKDSIESYVTYDNFLPVKFSMQQRESGQSVDDLQLFDSEKLKTYFYYHRLKKGKKKEINKEEFTPRFFTDSFSALHFIRGMNLNVGDEFVVPVVTRAKVWLLKAKVSHYENIEIMGKKVKAILIKAETQFPGVLKKSGDILFWYSADPSHKILKFEAKIKIGTVKGELIDYQEGRVD